MEAELLEIREQQKTSWNKSSSGWKKWDDLTMDFLKPYGEEIISQLKLKETDKVLDIAAGTGEPAISIAKLVPKGKVVITDLANEMLIIARENALKAGLENVEFQVCDVCELPYDDNSFDAISCRMGFMFFPDMQLAAKEMSRVLKPGGKIAVSVWCGPENNFWFSGIMGIVKQHINLPSPAPGSPGMFRCAEDGLIANLLEQAGFKQIYQQQMSNTLNIESAENYWSFCTEVVGPVVSALSTVQDELKEKIKSEVYALIDQRFPAGNVKIDSRAMIISAQKE